MSRKKNTSTNHNGNPPALKIGSRARCTDDGVEGRITWANAVSVKIKWDDGEQVTWKRDSLATRPIKILDADDDQTTASVATDTAAENTTATEVEQAEAPVDTAAIESTATTEQAQAEPETIAAAMEQADPETTATTHRLLPNRPPPSLRRSTSWVTEPEPMPTQPIATEATINSAEQARDSKSGGGPGSNSGAGHAQHRRR